MKSSKLTLKPFVRLPERTIGPVEQQGTEVNPHPTFFQKSEKNKRTEKETQVAEV